MRVSYQDDGCDPESADGQRIIEADTDYAVRLGFDPYAALEAATVTEAPSVVLVALSSLAFDDYSLLVSHYCDDVSLRELACELGSTYGAMRVRLCRARRRFREAMVASGY
jgi:DNA-directed RNA polymerase specialized sigma24 family protein